MFWIEETQDENSFVLFSKCSFEPFIQDLTLIGGMHIEHARSQKEGDIREGWSFSSDLKPQVEEFIEDCAEDIESADESQVIGLDQLYDLLLEATNRIDALERRVFKMSNSKGG